MSAVKNKMICIAAAFSVLMFSYIHASGTEYGENFGSIKITSFSEKWNDRLEEIYNELLLNFHSEEFNYLSDIYIYPDSPEGVNGYYFDNIMVGENGYEMGKKARIEIYNADRYENIEDMAYVISHEYGHHYMTYNILAYENKYIPRWKESEYAKIRNFENFNVIYGGDDLNLHTYDAGEIMADDYVQLLGSKNARRFVEFDENSPPNSYFKDIFNIKPQGNPYIPLAAQVEGLYAYLLKIGGYTGEISAPEDYPEITEISLENDICAVKWSKPEGNYKYTLVMYPRENPFTPVPIKTISQSEPSEAFIDIKKNSLEGEYSFKVYLSDSNNYIYSSKEYVHTFKMPEKASEESTAPSELSENVYSEAQKNEEHSPKKETDKVILRFTDALKISYYKRVIYI